MSNFTFTSNVDQLKSSWEGIKKKAEEQTPPTPWKDVGSDVFFPTVRTSVQDLERRWNRLCPYRLVVYDVEKNEIVSSGRFGSVTGAFSPTNGIDIDTQFLTQGVDYTLSQSTFGSAWVYLLPITPQQIQIVDNYAINTTATARGILEEHNAVKFKTISIKATTGIWTQRTSSATPTTPSSLGSVFAGTAQAFDNLSNSARKLASAFKGEGLNTAQPAPKPPVYQTGHYQALFLSNFIERYTQEKKNPRNKNWRLVLDMPKMDVSYVVSPVSFALEKSAQSPNETTFSLQLKAWKRIKLQADQIPASEIIKLSPNTFLRITNTIRQTRAVLSNSINLLKAVRSDFQTPLEALRQTALAIKDLGGLVNTAADLPKQIINDYKTSIADSLKIIKNAFQKDYRYSRLNSSSIGVTSSSIKKDSQQVKSSFIADAISAQDNVYEGLSLSQVQAGDLGSDAAASSDLNPVNVLFDSPEEFFEILDSIDINSLNLSPDQQIRIDDEVQAASLINIDDLNRFKSIILDTALLISNNYGAGDETYSTIYGRQPPKTRVTPLTVEETEVITALFEAVQVYDELTASGFFDTLRVASAVEYVGGLANEAEIDFDEPSGKVLRPVPFGLTIEQIAARYLGDANKWLEIVTINKLRLPYIDEEGFSYPLLSNGSGRQINVDDHERRIYIGQFLNLSSNNVNPFKRKVLNVEKISDNNYLVTLDGEDNLDNLTTAQNAKIRGYLPGTVNSQNQIFIPSDQEPEEDDLITTPRVFDADRLVKISKVDWLLDENGDVAVNEVGEIQLAGGLTNLIQAIRMKVKTQKGTLLQHLNYGLGIKPGISIADITSGEVINSLNKMIEDDKRFSGIERIVINSKGGVLTISMSVRIASGSGVLPITFEI